jgi:proton-translocating NADH-quinone oxidoreductase chain N
MVNPILLIAVPLFVSFLIPLINRIYKKSASIAVLATMILNFLVVINNYQSIMKNPMLIEISGWKAPFGINLYISSLEMVAITTISIITLILAIYNIKHSNFESESKFHSLFLAIIAGIYGIVMTGDIFNLFVFIEITTISAYGLTTFNKEMGFEAALKYIIVGSISSVFLLIAVGLTYSTIGSLNMAVIAESSHLMSPTLIRIITLLFFVGIGFEAGIFPLSIWVPDVHSTAPSAVSSTLSGLVFLAGMFAINRVFFTLFVDPNLYIYLLIIGATSLIFGELVAFQQEDIKRMLAYSSIAQMGLVLSIISVGTQLAVSGGLFQLMNHAVLKTLLFLTAGLMIEYTGSRKIKDYEGIGKEIPLVCIGFSVGAMGILGVPLFNGFVSKLMIINGSLNAEKYILTFLILFATLVEIAYYLKVIQKLFFGELKHKLKKAAPSYVSIIILIAIVFTIGIYPEIITGSLNQAANELLSRTNYILTVLGGM